MQLIVSLLWLWILGIIAGGSYILWALYVRGDLRRPAVPGGSRPSTAPGSVTTRKTVAPAPVAKPAAAPAAQPPLGPSRPTTQGSGDYQRRGAAPTVKVTPVAEAAKPAPAPAKAPAIGNDDEAMAELFSGVGGKQDVPEPTPKSIDKASRIEELGFHPGAKAEPASGAKPAVAPTEPAPAPAPAPVPENRSQTAELDDILKRIDAVLSDGGTPAADATLVEPQKQGHETLPVPQSPPKETDGGQQKLF